MIETLIAQQIAHLAILEQERDALKAANAFLVKEIKELVEKADADFGGDFTLGDARNWLVDTLKQHEVKQ